MPVARICKVYRSPRREGMYLYVAADDGLEMVPESLLQRFGTPEEAMTLHITPHKKLARAEASDVLQQIEDAGFYLQVPPPPGAEMQAIRNDKLPR